jgi:hypothetical protein
MGVGRNLAYKKALFTQNNGFESHKNVMSGDDDLFINDVATKSNTCIEISLETHTVSSVKISWDSWFHQKKRHLTTGPSYKLSNQLILSLFQASLIVFYTSFLYLIIKDPFYLPIIILFLTRAFIQIFIFKACIEKLSEKHAYILFPVYELFILFLNLILVISNIIYNPNTWQKT